MSYGTKCWAAAKKNNLNFTVVITLKDYVDNSIKRDIIYCFHYIIRGILYKATTYWDEKTIKIKKCAQRSKMTCFQVYLPSVTLLPDLMIQLPNHQPALGAIRTFTEVYKQQNYSKITNHWHCNNLKSYFIQNWSNRWQNSGNQWMYTSGNAFDSLEKIKFYQMTKEMIYNYWNNLFQRK